MLSNHEFAPLFQHNLEIFPATQAKLLNDLRVQWNKTKPLTGIKLLHNIPLTYETLVKLEPLLVAGAELTVTNTKFLGQPLTTIVSLLNRLGIQYIEKHENIKGTFDIALDCCAEVMDMPHVTISRGIAELTQTGGERYKQANTLYPVINVDESNLKKLEGMYGTGESFVRALKEKIGEPLKNRHFLVFGFGKVGRGIVKYLLKETPYVTVVDKSQEQLRKAEALNVEILHISQIETIKICAKKAFCLVTATGEPDFLSRYLTAKDCSQAIIANMGASDEIGSNFSNDNVLCSRMPINFSLQHPTLLHFIDPIFYAHNLVAQLLLENNYSPGYHPFPSYLDDLIIKLWNAYNPIDISDIYL
ncbi:NAD(P)-dependent oxidoreductase [Legionella cardiaca]|uniref:NAD(P)-dependent oxidoreductase n=1 Tax=Legionella cardiaca TaxID=1071983 RepID=A0ABY8AN29_9GAMM|nr:NAD(P)-dependent oxidoreductase [Legionella cardiaca]WED41864.1 NAD(P)-dependent oxidoreductase [Legionella cardiaca]